NNISSSYWARCSDDAIPMDCDLIELRFHSSPVAKEKLSPERFEPLGERGFQLVLDDFGRCIIGVPGRRGDTCYPLNPKLPRRLLGFVTRIHRRFQIDVRWPDAQLENLKDLFVCQDHSSASAHSAFGNAEGVSGDILQLVVGHALPGALHR